jgi:hypothetical protein
MFREAGVQRPELVVWKGSRQGTDFLTQHVKTFIEIPPRQEAMSADFAKLIEKFKEHATQD